MKKVLLPLLLLQLSFAISQDFKTKQKVKAEGYIAPPKLKFIKADNSLIAIEGIKASVFKNDDGEVVLIDLSNSISKDPKARKSYTDQSIAFFEKAASILKLKQPTKELELIEDSQDELGNHHFKYRQLRAGIEVYGSEVVLHEKNGFLTILTGKSYPSFEVFDNPQSITEQAAKEKAMAYLKSKTVVQNIALLKKIEQADPTPQLQWYTSNKKDFKLVWHMVARPNVLERFDLMIDAENGDVLRSINNTCTVNGPVKATSKDLAGISQSFQAYEFNGTNYLIDASKSMYKKPPTSVFPDDPVGVIWTIDALNTALGENTRYEQVTSPNVNSWSDVAVSAHINASACYDYFLSKHNRLSLNAKGGNIVSVVNLRDEDGKNMDNAFWNGYYMGYGNGATAFTKLAKAIDVAGHEMTHGVVENSAKLEYVSQSGALNESMADVFGVLIENKDVTDPAKINWTLGEQVVLKSAFPSGALRSLSNPNQGGTSLRSPGYQPARMSQYVALDETPEEDNGGVHVNSGIPNHAFYQFASKPEIGLAKAEKVYYQALTKYLTRFSQFVDLRIAVVQSAKDVYPNDPAVEAAAKAAFDLVGIKDPNAGTPTDPAQTPTKPTTELPVNSGSEYLIVLEPSTNDIYVGPSAVEDFKVFKGIGMRSRPSATDDGTAVYFVGNDKNIYRIANPTNKATAALTKLTENAVWDNTSVSKDGKRLAALRATEDKFMYLFNLEKSGDNKSFQLYNPTYSQGVTTGEVLYADSFEWDYKNENIVYDAYNTLKKQTGESIDYWDVGIIKVWDSAKNTWAAGTIQKLFSNLEEGDNIGNPSYSKTSPDVLVFDYFNSKTDANTFKILGVNIYNNTIKEIATSKVPGFPNYTVNDKYITFNSRSTNSTDISRIEVKTSKIEPIGISSVIYTDASLGVWFASGKRALPQKQTQTISFKAISDQAKGAKVTLEASSTSKLPVIYSVISGDATITDNILTCGSTLGQVVVRAIQNGNNDFNAATAVEIKFNIIEAVKKAQTISVGAISDKFPGDKIIVDVSASSKLPVTLKVISGAATVQDQTITCGNTLGEVLIRASQAGNAEFSAALEVDFKFKIIAKPTGVLAIDQVSETLIYPNPADALMSISGSETASLKLYDAKGKLIKHESSATSLAINELPSGVYYLQIEKAQKTETKRIIKN